MLYLFLWLILSIIVSSVGSIYYSKTIKKVSNDIYRILLFIFWIAVCIFLPIFTFLWVLDNCEADISNAFKIIIIIIWTVPIYHFGYRNSRV